MNLLGREWLRRFFVCNVTCETNQEGAGFTQPKEGSDVSFRHNSNTWGDGVGGATGMEWSGGRKEADSLGQASGKICSVGNRGGVGYHHVLAMATNAWGARRLGVCMRQRDYLHLGASLGLL